MPAKKYSDTPMCWAQLLDAFEPTCRDTDVFVTTAPKCGQTWLLNLLYHLKTGGEDPDLSRKGLLDLCPWLEIRRDLMTRELFDLQQRLGAINEITDPRIFKMHVLWQDVPRPPTSKAKVITITRDPRDVPYSMFCHLHAMNPDNFHPDMEKPPPSFDAYFERWLEAGFYFEFIASMWPHRHDSDVLWLRFEDLKRDIRAAAQQCADFLGWECSPAIIERIIPLVSFEHLRKRENTTRANNPNWKQDANFFREGKVGKNRQRLSTNQEARILARAKQDFPPACFEYVVNITS